MKPDDVLERMLCSNAGSVLFLEAPGALVSSGEFVQYRGRDSLLGRDIGAGVSAGQVISIEERHYINPTELQPLPRGRGARIARRNRLARRTDDVFDPRAREKMVLLRHMEVVEASKRCRLTDYSNVHDSIVEVIETCKLEWVPVASVQSICFIYHIATLQNGGCPWHSGTKNCFLIKQRMDGNNEPEDIPVKEFQSFFSPLGFETYSKRISNGVGALYELVSRAMTGSKKNWLARTQHIHMLGGNKELFDYLIFMAKQGIKEGEGCPDSDGDGVYDHLDVCPATPGTVANKGCPEIKEEVKEQIRLAAKGIFFESGKGVIKAESFTNLDKLASIMNSYEEANVMIEGHTDSQGADAANMTLSQKRADAVKRYLASKGVTESRMTAIGYGETKPVADNGSAEGRALNRRVDFKLVY